MKLAKIIIIDILFLCGIYFGGYLEIEIIKNVTLFYSWLIIILGVLAVTLVADKDLFKKELNTKLYNYINIFLSIVIITGLIAVGWWVTGVFLTVVTFIIKAKKIIYFEELNEVKK
jgi:hypothetical protein